MKKVYFDQTQVDGCISIFSSRAEVIPAGTTMNAMPVKYKNETYQQEERELGVQFLYQDAVPEVPFFAVPHLEIVATDAFGGFLGILHGEGPVVYIDRNRNCFHVAQNVNALLDRKESWRESMTISSEVVVYVSKEAAMAELEFIDPMQRI